MQGRAESDCRTAKKRQATTELTCRKSLSEKRVKEKGHNPNNKLPDMTFMLMDDGDGDFDAGSGHSAHTHE